MSTDRDAVRGRGIRRRIMVMGSAMNLVPAVVLSTVVTAAMAAVTTATSDAAPNARIPVKRPTTASAASLIPRGAAEVRAADGLRAGLMTSDAAIAAATSRLRVLSAQANPRLASFSATRTAKATAKTEARAQGTRLVDLGLLMDQSSRCGKCSPIYANGRWPPRARCPLYAAPDQTLRRAAAFAFNRMSYAYQRQSGSALCVTEGYRSYAEQVAVKQRLPGLAAAPGTSKHGLGLAVDLCGGVQNFTNPAHQWLKRNARHFGWFHPAWAEPSGGLPEPWHWEFAR